jgi:hypothetical protein
VDQSDKGGEATGKDPLSLSLRKALEHIARSGGMPALKRRRTPPSKLVVIVDACGGGSLANFIKLVLAQAEEIDSKQNRLALKAALAIASPADDLGEEYAEKTSTWHEGTKLSHRVSLFREYWEKILDKKNQDPGLVGARSLAIFYKTRDWWYAGRDELADLLVKEVERRNDTIATSKQAGTMTITSLAEEQPPAGSGATAMAQVEAALTGHWTVKPQPLVWLVAGIAILSMLATAKYSPAQSRQPFSTITSTLGSGDTLHVIWWGALLAGAYGALFAVASGTARTGPRRQIASLVVVAILASLSQSYAIGQWYFYVLDTSQARSIEAAARDGDLVVREGFDESGRGRCSEGESITSPSIALNQCDTSGGVLHAKMTSPQDGFMGAYPVDPMRLRTVSGGPSEDQLRFHAYYMEATVRPRDDTPISACGLSVEGDADYSIRDPRKRARSLLFRVQSVRESSNVRYRANIIATHISGIESPYSSLVYATEFATPRADLPFVGRAAVPGWRTGTWTKLSVLLRGDQFTFFVNDRAVYSSSYPGLQNVSRATVAVTAGTPTSGGMAECDFGYLRVRRLPN